MKWRPVVLAVVMGSGAAGASCVFSLHDVAPLGAGDAGDASNDAGALSDAPNQGINRLALRNDAGPANVFTAPGMDTIAARGGFAFALRHNAEAGADLVVAPPSGAPSILDSLAKAGHLAIEPGSDLFVTTANSACRVPLPEGGVCLVEAMVPAPTTGIAISGTTLYLTTNQAAYRAVLLGDGGVAQGAAIATGLRGARQPVLSGGALFFREAPDDGGPGAIMVVGDGGARVFVVPASGGELAADAEYVYFSENSAGRVWAAPNDGGAPILLACGQLEPNGMAVDATHVYFANTVGNHVARVPKPAH